MNLKDGTPHYQGNPGYVAPQAAATPTRLGSVSAIRRPLAQQPGRDHADEDDEGLDPGTGTDSEPTSLPDEAPPVEPEDFDGNKAAMDTRQGI
ncbi:hypothetical protein J3Q00_14210 [Pseudomonas sp. D2-3]